MIIDEQPIKLKLNLGAVGAVPGSRAGAVGAVPGSRTGGGPGGRPSPAGGPRSPSKKPLKVRKFLLCMIFLMLWIGKKGSVKERK